jgi:hypothetical protein
VGTSSDNDTPVDDPETPTRGIGRRSFLKFAGGVGVVLAADPHLGGTTTTYAAGNGPEVGPWQLPGPRPPSFTTVLRRPDDLVRLRIDGFNLRVDRGPAQPRLVLIEPTRFADVMVTFPPQSLLEEALPFPASNPAQGSLQARLAGPTRLAFRIIPEVVGTGIPYTVASLLDWSRWLLVVPEGAQRAAGDPAPPPPNLLNPPALYRPTAPLFYDTTIEVPWWLQISPNRRAGFVSATRPQPGRTSGHTELWHARLATRAPIGPGPTEVLGPLSEAPSPDRVIRAVWSPDPELGSYLLDAEGADDAAKPFRAAMTQLERVSLIRLTSDESLRVSPAGPVPVPVDSLMLTPLGAYLDAGVTFPEVTSGSIDLVEWRHRSTLARDQYVRIVERGYLMPFGHKAVLVTITERKFVGTGGARSAVLEQRQFLRVIQPLVDHDATDAAPTPSGPPPTGGRQIPFRRVRLRTLVTPEVDRVALPGHSFSSTQVFFPVLAGTTEDVVFEATAIDRDGRSVDVSMPMAFVSGTLAENPDEIPQVRAAWNSYQHPTRRWARLNGQRVAYAPPLPARPGATSVTTDRIRFDVSPLADENLMQVAGRRRFFADMRTAEVRLDDVAAVTGNELAPVTIGYDPVYRSDGFGDSNRGGLWAELATSTSLRFSRPPTAPTQPGPGTDKSGGFVSPDLEIRGLSRSLGVAAGDPATLRSGTFSPAAFFAGPGAPKLLGGISLLDVIVDAVLTDGDVAPGTALSITTRRTADAVESLVLWTPELQPDPLGIFQPGTFRLESVTRTPLDGNSVPSSRIDGELSNFSLNIPIGDVPLIIISVNRLSFSTVDGRDADIDVDVGDVGFGGELAYIATLSKYLSFGTGGPEIEVLPDRIAIGLSIAIPNITFGVFALRNIRFIAGLDVPLSGDPVRVRFALSTRDDPFRLTVLCVGGGGYVALAFGADGLEALEMGLEAGAEAALDFGVASGSVSVMVGVVLLVSKQDGIDTASFLAYFRINGSVSAGPVSASITLTLELGYEERTKGTKTARTLYGRGTLEIDISVPLVPTPPITITVERSLKSDAADPTFADQLDEADWTDYCDAYGAA